MNYMQKMWIKVYYEALRANVAPSSRAYPSDMDAAKRHADSVIASLTKLNGGNDGAKQ
ncbi:TPA: hypothetical protein ACIVAT_000607 [Salmonella enterica subsp. enterica serovar Waycross]